MKRQISIMLAGIICCATLSACANTSNNTAANTTTSITTAGIEHTSSLPAYESYICSMTNDGYITSADKDWWSGGYIKESIKDTKMNVNIGTGDFSVSYKQSHLKVGNRTKTHSYIDTKNDLTYYTRSDTGEFLGFFFGVAPMKEQDNLPDIPNTETAILDMADKYVSAYINTDKYIRTHSVNESRSAPNTHVYNIVYTKYIGDLATADTLYIEITSKGFVKSLHMYNISAFDSITCKIDMSKVNDSIANKVNASYTNKVVEYKVEKQYLGYTPDGDLIVISQLRVTLSDSEGNIETGLVISTAV